MILTTRVFNRSPEKVEAVLEAPHPQRVTEMRSFVGLDNYYNRFMANPSSVVQPLNQLLEKNHTWEWMEDCLFVWLTIYAVY